MIIATGTSGRTVSAMAEHLMIKLRAEGEKPKSEGEKYGDWVVIDAGDVIVHLFRAEVRTFYNIERIWSAPANTGKAPVKAAKPAKTAKAAKPAKKAVKKAPARKPARRA